MPSLQVLVIDDEPALRQILSAFLTQAGYGVETAAGATEALAKLARGEADVALCDIKMPDGDGIEVLRRARASGCETAFVMVTAMASMESAVEALRAGAHDYLVKPVREEELLHRLSQIEAERGLREENRALRRAVRQGSAPVFRFQSDGMREVEHLVAKVAPTSSTVLVVGESGTGKGLAARAIHELSPRANRAFVEVNCSAIPETLMESEFFGHIRGAFTGAERARKGMFLEADQGTLFLDEIGELPLPMQTKLLHAIEHKRIRPVGSETPRRVDARIVAATNRDLPQMVARGAFREDLYFRLTMFQIQIPPLRERQDDIRGLIRFLLAGAREGPRGRAMLIDAEAEAHLLAHTWPGNVRELENVINRARILAEGDVVTVADLPTALVGATRQAVDAGLGLAGDGGLREQLQRHERDIIRGAIEAENGDRRAAARRLGISLSSLYRKVGEPAPEGRLTSNES